MESSKNEILEFIEKYKIITVLRAIALDKIIPLAHALYEGGIRMVEVPFLQDSKTKIKDTVDTIKILSNEMKGKMHIGAGTVMSEEEVKEAKEAGAKYILSPNTNIKIIEYTNKLGLISIPGAFTPTEIITGYEAGAEIIKLFPAGILGIEYIKAIKAPISHVPLLAFGGITENNMRDFLSVGVMGFGIGTGIVKDSLIANGDFDGISKLAKMYTDKLK